MSGRIDYVLARPSGTCALTVPASEVIADEPSLQADGRWLWPSDHLGFASTVSCGPAPSPADTVAVAPTAPADGETATAGGRLPATGATPQLALAMLLAALGVTAAAATRRRRTRAC
jgi:hypothetical protein